VGEPNKTTPRAIKTPLSTRKRRGGEGGGSGRRFGAARGILKENQNAKDVRKGRRIHVSQVKGRTGLNVNRDGGGRTEKNSGNRRGEKGAKK